MSSSGRWILLLALLGGCGKPPPPRPQDPALEARRAEARKLLAEAGFPDGKGFPRLEALYNDAEWHKRIAVAIQSDWKRHLGIDIEVRSEEWKVFLANRGSGRFQIARGGFTGEYRDPHAFLSLFGRDSGFNSSGWRSDAYDTLLADADAEVDAAKRLAVLAKAERLLLDEMPVFPVFHYVGHNWLRPFVKGVVPNYRDMHPMQHVWLEGAGAPRDGVLIFWAGDECASLDPGLSHDMRGLKTAMALFEGLCNYDPKDASPVPGVAERWDISPDGRTYTFHLRAAQWSNGDPVTARDFAWAWRRVVDPETASNYKDRMYFVKNGRAIARGEKPIGEFGVRAVDDRTFVVELEHPAPYFLDLVCLNIFFPVHRATVEKHGKDWTRVENLVHNGPFRLVQWKVNDRQVFEKNPRWHGASGVKLQKFVWLSGSSPKTGFDLYESGACHWTFVAPPDRMDEVVGRADYLGGPYNASYFYVFNVNVKPLDDPRVRRALALAIDRRTICEKVVKGGETPADRISPMLYPGYAVP